MLLLHATNILNDICNIQAVLNFIGCNFFLIMNHSFKRRQLSIPHPTALDLHGQSHLWKQAGLTGASEDVVHLDHGEY